MKTAIAILNWNGRILLEEFLPSVVLHSKNDAEIYVIDNSSTDDSVGYLKQHFPEVQIIQNNSNKGYTGGYNEGLKHIDADLFVLLNSDVAVTSNWLSPIIEQFKKNQNLAAAQPKILDYKNKEYFEYAGAAGGFIDKYGFPFCRGRIFNTLEKDEGQYDGISEIFWASGACFFVRSNRFWEAGGFDEDYFAHQEEIDLCWRFFNKGYKVMYVGNSKVFHLGGGTLNSLNPKKTYLNFRNSLFNLQKHVPKNKFPTIVFMRLVFDGLAGILFLMTFKFNHFLSILKSHFSFYFNFKKNQKKSDKLLKPVQYFYVKSIIFTYFIKNKKIFKKLE